jgi:hypothetical protein
VRDGGRVEMAQVEGENVKRENEKKGDDMHYPWI